MRSSVELSHEENIADAHALRLMLEAIDGCPAPVVARVQGHALGGGAGLVAAADIAIAAPDAVFAFSEVKLGIIPAVISPFALREDRLRAPRGAISSRANGSTRRPRCASGSCTRSQTTSTPPSTACSASSCPPARSRPLGEAPDPRTAEARRPRAG